MVPVIKTTILEHEVKEEKQSRTVRLEFAPTIAALQGVSEKKTQPNYN